MTLQASGPISLGDIQGEFGGSPAISISEYYRNNALVIDDANNTGIPNSGSAIAFSQFYGQGQGATVSSGTTSYTSAGSAIEFSTAFSVSSTVSIDISYSSTGITVTLDGSLTGGFNTDGGSTNGGNSVTAITVSSPEGNLEGWKVTTDSFNESISSESGGGSSTYSTGGSISPDTEYTSSQSATLTAECSVVASASTAEEEVTYGLSLYYKIGGSWVSAGSFSVTAYQYAESAV